MLETVLITKAKLVRDDPSLVVSSMVNVSSSPLITESCSSKFLTVLRKSGLTRATCRGGENEMSSVEVGDMLQAKWEGGYSLKISSQEG